MQTQPSRFIFESRNLSAAKKKAAYEDVVKQIDAALAGETHHILKMATINCLLREALPYYFWTGFYLVHEGELVVGPYQGTLGCLHISFDRGVCGAAARTQETQIVPDVHKFPGHIACDSKSRSEIVVPVFNKKKELIAVFDVDSTKLASFDEIDQKYLENILQKQFAS
jgi:L-methionine (R)-S-oxide reductase